MRRDTEFVPYKHLRPAGPGPLKFCLKGSGFFAARCYASAAYAIMRCVCLSVFVCVSVTFVHSLKTNKGIFISSKFFHHRAAKRDGDIPTETPLMVASNAGAWG